MTNPSLLPLSTLSQSAHPYIINAIGSLRRNPVSQANHLLEVIASTIIPGQSLHQHLISATAKREKYHISLGEFFAYYPGCRFENGLVYSRPKKPNFSQTLDFSLKNIRFIRSDDKSVNGDNCPLIQRSDYQLGAALSSQLLAVGAKGDPYAVLIPTIEIIRYFYGGSSTLNQALFSPAILDLGNFIHFKRRETTGEQTSFNQKTRTLTLVLKKDIPDSDACVIGQWLMDKYAHSQAIDVYNSLLDWVHTPQEPKRLSFEVYPPFVGKSRLQGIGVKIRNPASPQKPRFLLLNILASSNLLPFDALRLDRTNSGKKAPDSDGIDREEKPIAFAVPKPTSPNGKTKGQNNPLTNPSGNLQRETVDIQMQRFPNIAVIPIEKTHTTHRAGPTPNPVSTPPDNQSTSDIIFGETDALPINLVPTKHTPPCPPKQLATFPADFSSFQRICDELINHADVFDCTSVLINPLDSLTQIGPDTTSSFPTGDDDNPISWSFIATPDGSNKVRQAIVMQVTSVHGVHYLLEVERGKTPGAHKFAIYIFSNAHRAEVKQGEIEALFTGLAKHKFKSYKRTFGASHFDVTARLHKGTAKSCAAGIMDKIYTQRKITKESFKNSADNSKDILEAV